MNTYLQRKMQSSELFDANNFASFSTTATLPSFFDSDLFSVFTSKNKKSLTNTEITICIGCYI